MAGIQLQRYPDMEGAEHEFVLPTHYRVDERFQNFGFAPTGYEGFPNVLPFSWHRETFASQLARLRAKGVPGCIMEFGTAQGGSTRQLSRLAPERRLYTFDVFTGVPKEKTIEIDNRSPSKDGSVVDFTSWPFLPEHWKQFYPNVVVYEGLFENSLPRFAQDHPNEPVALAYVDCNLYASTKEVLAFIESRLSTGSVVIFDDYSGHEQCDGARKAAEEWRDSNIGKSLAINDLSSLEGEGLYIIGT